MELNFKVNSDEVHDLSKCAMAFIACMGATDVKALENEAASLQHQEGEKKLDFVGNILTKIVEHPVVSALLAKSTGLMLTKDELAKKTATIVCNKINDRLDEEFAKFESRLSALEKSDTPAEETPAESTTETTNA